MGRMEIVSCHLRLLGLTSAAAMTDNSVTMTMTMTHGVFFLPCSPQRKTDTNQRGWSEQGDEVEGLGRGGKKRRIGKNAEGVEGWGEEEVGSGEKSLEEMGRGRSGRGRGKEGKEEEEAETLPVIEEGTETRVQQFEEEGQIKTTTVT